ncbi:MAG: hypothetical protein WD598_11950 [Acidimicrobiia bacterium]
MTTTKSKSAPSAGSGTTWRNLSPRSLDLIAFAILAAGFLLPLRGLLGSPGAPMEEGFMLVFPERVLAGDIPNKDFLHLYGPGSLWVLAAVYKVFGTTLVTERLFGLIQEAAVVFGIYFIVRPWGRTTALGCALVSLLIILEPHGLVAMPWVGALGLGVFGIVAGIASRDAGDSQRGRRLALTCGLLFGLALLYRIDLVIAITLASLALASGVGAAVRKRFALGLTIGLFPYLIHVATAGLENVVQGMLIDPVVHLRGGRALPIPPNWNVFDSDVQFVADFIKLPWPIPRLDGPAQISLWFFGLLGSLVFVAVVAIWAVRRDRTSPRARVLLAAAGFSVGLIPQALQRPDPTHLAWVACVGMAFVPVAAVEVIQARRPGWGRRPVALVVGAAFLLGLTLVIPNYTLRSYADFTAQTFGEHVDSHPMKNGGRTFYNGNEANAKAANKMFKVINRITKPGDRLFVGSKDLRKAPLSEASFYFLLPDLPPATYYIEMDPGIANAPDSGLADEVRNSDILILSSTWEIWDEPNDSRKFGPNEPNEVVRDEFCLVDKFGPHYYLYQHCRGGAR